MVRAQQLSFETGKVFIWDPSIESTDIRLLCRGYLSQISLIEIGQFKIKFGNISHQSAVLNMISPKNLQKMLIKAFSSKSKV